MSNFQMKQFAVKQEKSAMKIGTDGVLLGAWVALDETENAILDVGAGTGIIGLMLAQRSPAELIDAIELDDHAFEECVENFEVSPWGDRLFCYHASFQEFVEEMDEQYNLIVSNPPFFNHKDSERASNPRNKARFTDSLYFEELISGASKLLTDEGKFAVIIPYSEAAFFVNYAKEFGLQLVKRCDVKGNPQAELKRSLLMFQKTDIPQQPHTEELTIEIARHQYTPEYIQLTKDFYLDM